MKTNLAIKFVLVSLFCAVVFGGVTVLVLRNLTENSTLEFRRHTAVNLAHNLEGVPLEQALSRYEANHPGGRLYRGHFWIVSEDGKVLLSNQPAPLPVKWERLPKPEKAHEIGLSYRFWGLTPVASVIRLDSEPPAYLIMGTSAGPKAYHRDFLEISFFVLALAFSSFLSLLMVFFYLRNKSREARRVLLKMESGDLKARFQIKNFDEMGSLMLDFNRMAAEIERLVGRIKETEQARKMFFQEISHDLRTPLTSLRAAIDTMATHWEDMPESHRKEVIQLSQMEISYFMGLLENLLFISEIDEPRYKMTTERVDIKQVLGEEIRTHRALVIPGESKIDWKLELADSNLEYPVSGDLQLIRRLFKNIIDNASRFAKTTIAVSVKERDGGVVVEVCDDGPGITKEQIAEFGKGSSRRVVNGSSQSHISLGLGSVIIQKIIELHQGKFLIKSSLAGTLPKGQGTVFEVFLPRVRE